MIHLIRQLGGITAPIFALLLLLEVAPVRSEELADQGAPPPPSPALLLEELRPELHTFSYRQTGRPDPFMPFLATLPAAPGEEHEEEELTGLRRFEPGQLTLTAIALTARGPLAMIEDATGYGHIIRPGTAIGRTGRVERIEAGRVIIRQQVSSWTGEPEYRTVEMVLTIEGEKK